LVIALISSAVLSRLLTPAEFGICALINALSAVISASFQEFGGTNYLIQKNSLTEQNIRTAFTITMCLSILFAATLFELRDVAAWFFSEDSLKRGIAVVALGSLLGPFLMTMSALLSRDMAFALLARCNLVARFVVLVISIIFAVYNYSFMAPLLGGLAGSATLLALFITSRRNWRIFCPSFAGYWEVIHFGAYSSGTAFINIFYNLTPQLILGRILDFTAVGLYSRAINVTGLFDHVVLQVLSPVIMPAIFAHTRGGGDLRRMYLAAIELIAVVQWPFLITFALLAEPIIWIWFGPTWDEIVPLIQMLCLASLSLFGACLTYPVLVAVGRVRDTLVSSLISLPPSLIIIFVASFFGVQAVAAAALLTLPFQAVVAFCFISRHLAISPADLFRATLKSSIVTACVTAGVSVISAIAEFNSAGPTSSLLLGGIFAIASWGLGLVVTKHPLLNQMRSAARGIAFTSLRFPFLGQRATVIRPDRKSPQEMTNREY
jgi:O-antigen/teichoic acid export membrane protein